jgi:hypothetical protein
MALLLLLLLASVAGDAVKIETTWCVPVGCNVAQLPSFLLIQSGQHL